MGCSMTAARPNAVEAPTVRCHTGADAITYCIDAPAKQRNRRAHPSKARLAATPPWRRNSTRYGTGSSGRAELRSQRALLRIDAKLTVEPKLQWRGSKCVLIAPETFDSLDCDVELKCGVWQAFHVGWICAGATEPEISRIDWTMARSKAPRRIARHQSFGVVLARRRAKAGSACRPIATPPTVADGAQLDRLGRS